MRFLIGFILGFGGVATGAPINDNFALADDLGSAVEARRPILSYGATRQVGEPAHDGNRSAGSLWWTWTAPGDGLLRLDLRDRGSSKLAVYTGDSLDGLVEVDSAGSLPLDVPVAAGVAYRIALADKIADELRLRFLAEAANDDFAARADLGTVSEFSEPFETLTASREAGEPAVGGDSTLGASVWWSWEAPEDGLLRLELEVDWAWDWRLGVFEGDELAALVEVANLYAPTDLALRVPAGKRLALVACRDDAGAVGEGVLKGGFEPMPYHPERDEALDLGTALSATGGGSTVGDGDRAIWWSWTAPDHGLLKWEVVGVTGGAAVSTRVEDASGTTISLRSGDGGHPVRGGETYFLRASIQNAAVAYQLGFTASQANDDFADPAPLGLGENGFDLTWAGTDADEPDSHQHRSLWWTWTAPADGLLRLEPETLHEGPTVRIWEEPAAGNPLVSRWSGPLKLSVAAGTTYRIGVTDGSSAMKDTGPGVLRAIFLPAGPVHDDLADAIDLGNGLQVFGEGTLEGATAEAGETVLPYGDASVWWKWTAPQAVRVSLRADNSLDHFRLWTGGGIGSLTELARGSEVAAGETVWISLGGWTGTTRMEFFELRASPAAANDAFLSAIDLGPVESADERFVLGETTLEAGESHGWLTGGSRWWRWTAPRDLNVRLAIESKGAVYAGDTLAGLERLAEIPYGVVDFAADAGETYHFAVLGAQGDFGALRFSTTESPPGDRYGSPVELGSPERFTLVGPDQGGMVDGPGRVLFPQAKAVFWWRWTAPADGWLDPGGEWHVVRDGAGGAEIVEDGAVVAGESYRLAFARGFSGYAREWRFFGTVPNDIFAGAIDLGSAVEIEARWTVWGTGVDAQELALLPEWAAQADTAGWWKWTAPFTGSLDFRGKGIGWLDGMVTVLRGTDPATMEVLRQPGSGFSGFSFGDEFGVVEGETYVFLVATRGSRLGEEVSLTLTARPGPPNDEPEAAVDLGSATEIEASGSNVGALGDEIDGVTSGPGVWWRWTAPAALRVRVGADVAGGDQRVRIFRELAGGGMEEVDHGSVINRVEESAVVFASRAGEAYRILVAGHGSKSEGVVQLALRTGGLVANDDFAAAEGLAGPVPPTIGGWHEGTLEAGEPRAGWPADAVSSLWWSWTAEADGVVVAERSHAVLRVLTDDGAGGWEVVSISDYADTGTALWEAEAGRNYRLAVIGRDHTPGFFEIAFRGVARPANDDFADALDLGAEAEAGWSGEVFLATAEVGEPAQRNSVWFGWTAPTDGIFRADTAGSTGHWRVDVYEGGSLDALTAVAGRTGGVHFEAVAGRSYRIAASLASSSLDGGLELRIGPDGAPVNDDFDDRLRIEGDYAVIAGSTMLAGQEPGEVWSGPGWRSLWWEWVAPANGELSLNRWQGSTMAMFFEASSGVPTAANPGVLVGPPGSWSRGWVSAGQRYFFRIASDPSQPAGTAFWYEMKFRASDFLPAGTVRPRNDLFAKRTDLGGATGVRVVGDFYGASLEGGGGRYSIGGSLWWSWTAPKSGFFAVRIHGELTPDETAVVTGDRIGELVTVASTRNSSADLWFEAVAGESYAIRFFQRQTRSTDFDDRYLEFELVEEPESGPANDDFAAAEDLGVGYGGAVSGSNAGAGAEIGEPAHGGSAAASSVWYAWTAAESGTARLSATGGAMRAGIYQGDAPDALVVIGTGTEPLEFPVVAGESYRIALDSSVPVAFRLFLSEAPVAVPMSPDDFADAEELVGTVVDFVANADGAGVEPGEPLHDDSGWNEWGSVWFRWTAPADGPVEVGPAAGGSVRQMAVYRGDSLATLVRVGGARYPETVRFFAEAGVEYRIAVAETAGSDPMRLEQSAVVAQNGLLASAEELVGAEVSVQGTTVGAGREAGEVDWGFSPMFGTVWYRWQAPGDGVLLLTLSGAETRGLGLLRVSDSGGLERVADASTSSGTATVGRWVEAGAEYRIGVGIDAYDEPGPFGLALDWSPPAANVDVESAVDLGPVAAASLRGLSLDADGDGSARWWRWTAPVDGSFLLRDAEGTFQRRIELFQRIHGSVLKVQDSQIGGEPVAWRALAGEEYLFSVKGTALNAGGSFEVVLGPLDAPNDDPAGARRLADGLPAEDVWMAAGATRAAGETFPLGSLWWEWRALEDGRVEVDLGGSENPLELVVYRDEGILPGRLVRLLDHRDDRWSFEVEAGMGYRLEIGSQFFNRRVTGRVELRLRGVVELPNDHFADASILVGDGFEIATPTSGATLEDGEPVSGPAQWRHAHSLWWSWMPPRDGIATLETGADNWAFLYEDGELGALEKAERGVYGLDGLYRVEAGRRYLLAAGDRRGGELALTLSLSPAGDLFDRPIELGAAWESTAAGSWAGATREEFEPSHGAGPAERSIWFRWRAPASGTLSLALDSEAVAAGVAVYRGAVMDGLTRVSGGEAVEVAAGEEYRIAVDSSAIHGGVAFTLGLALEVPAYETWAAGHFAVGEAGSGPADDPDGDGRPNVFELTTGTDPRAFDGGAALEVRIEGGETIAELRRLAGLEGWWHEIEGSADLLGWTSRMNGGWEIEDLEDGTEILRVRWPAEETREFLRVRTRHVGGGGTP